MYEPEQVEYPIDEKYTVSIAGELFDIRVLVRYHQSREPRIDSNETANNKHLLINPRTEKPFDAEEIKQLQKLSEQRLLSLIARHSQPLLAPSNVQITADDISTVQFFYTLICTLINSPLDSKQRMRRRKEHCSLRNHKYAERLIEGDKILLDEPSDLDSLLNTQPPDLQQHIFTTDELELLQDDYDPPPDYAENHRTILLGESMSAMLNSAQTEEGFITNNNNDTSSNFRPGGSNTQDELELLQDDYDTAPDCAENHRTI